VSLLLSADYITRHTATAAEAAAAATRRWAQRRLMKETNENYWVLNY